MASIRNRGGGSWQITVSLGYNPDGTKKVKTCTFKTNPIHTEKSQRKEAEQYAAELETDLRRGVLTAAKQRSVKEVSEMWLEDASRSLAASTVAFYQHCLNTRILPALGNVMVQKLTPQMISRFYKSLETAKARTARSKTGKLSGNTQLHYHRCLSALLSFAQKRGLVSVNAAQYVSPPRNDVQETKILQPEEAVALIDALEDLPTMWHCFFLLALFSQARPGELIALNWSDVDFRNESIAITAGSVRIPGGGTQRKDTKTRKGHRTVVLPSMAIDLLLQWQVEQALTASQMQNLWHDCGAVFTGETGNRLNVSSPTKKFQKFLKAHPDLPRVPLYSLRHTGASLLIAQGVSAVDVSHRLGHSSTQVTLGVYTHAFQAADRRAADAITEALQEARKR